MVDEQFKTSLCIIQDIIKEYFSIKEYVKIYLIPKERLLLISGKLAKQIFDVFDSLTILLLWLGLSWL